MGYMIAGASIMLIGILVGFVLGMPKTRIGDEEE